jgi:putative restriction endonuclease
MHVYDTKDGLSIVKNAAELARSPKPEYNTIQEDTMHELDIRIAAFAWLKEHGAANGGVFPGTLLNEGFIYQGRRITLRGPAGIWFPQGFSLPISITTRQHGRYPLDGIDADGLLTYAYQGKDPNNRDNRGLREAFRTRTPLICFLEGREHHYQAIWPLMVLEDYPEQLIVRAAMDPAYAQLRSDSDPSSVALSPLDLRRYVWSQTRQRLHQGAFRDVVITAYAHRCTICRLGHTELLDAAHIIPDAEDRGAPVVQNGLSLCKIHHAAYDAEILGIGPDYKVHISTRILQEHDGPMLRHGLQELDGTSIVLPTHSADHPDRERLDHRFQKWLAAS